MWQYTIRVKSAAASYCDLVNVDDKLGVGTNNQCVTIQPLPSLTWGWLLIRRESYGLCYHHWGGICYLSFPVYFYSNFRNKRLGVRMTLNLESCGLSEPHPQTSRVKQMPTLAHLFATRIEVQNQWNRMGICQDFRDQGLTVRDGRVSGCHCHLTCMRQAPVGFGLLFW